MSDLLQGLMGQFGGAAISQMASKIGGDESATKSALGSALPILVSALAKNASTPDGAASLDNALSKKHDGGILGDVAGFLGGGQSESMGAGILKHVLGGKTNNVEKYVSDDSGLSSGAVGSIMKMAAPIVMGYLGQQKQQSGGGASLISGLLNSAVSGTKTAAPKSQNIIEQLLDQDNDGSVVDDVAQLGMSFLGNMFK